VSTTDLTALTGVTTSFPSKSEMALNLSTNRNALTFLGYNSGVSAIDVSNSNTPNHIDPSNTDTQTPTNRSVVQINPDGSVQVTNTNAYSGNNGRAVILANNVTAPGKANICWPAMPVMAVRRRQPISSTTPACSR
jgi:microcystin-dependent protein